MAAEVRQLVLVLGDQLDRASSAFDGFDPARDSVWMAEVDAESTHVPSSKARTAMFLSAMRHFADGLRAEGFVRQILGWREYVCGISWTRKPGYLDLDALDALDAHEALPAFYWRGDVPMACLADAIGSTLAHGYAHHIQRLMVTGLYALRLGVAPRELHAWYLAVYVDAVEWVELPNTLGMSQYADGGLMASKPYAIRAGGGVP